MTVTPRLTSALALLCASGALAACGSSGKSSKESTATPASASGGGEQVKLTAEEPGPGRFAFSKSKLTAKAGSVTLTMDNPGSDKAPHAIAVEGNGVDKDGQVVQPGSTSTVTADLKPGTYTFYCPVDGHRQEGMEGTLTVK